ncbi:MAG: hypothetical protein QNI84_14825 [Henriciella sp.]|nr:hypothetical protein [Henriciella sp.]
MRLLLSGLLALGAMTTLTLPATAAPCSVVVGQTNPDCSAARQLKIIKIEPAETRDRAGVTVVGRGLPTSIPPEGEVVGPQVFSPALAYRARAAACKNSIRRVPDLGQRALRFEICTSPLSADSEEDVAALYRTIRSASRRVCRLNGVTDGEPHRNCVRDTLYRAVIDAQRPELTTYYTSQTGRRAPRVEVNPAIQY